MLRDRASAYLLDESLSEGAQADCYECSVVEDHRLRVYFVDVVLDVRHQQLVSRDVVAVVEGVVVHGAQQGASATEEMKVIM